MGLAVNNITGWCPLSKQWRGVGQWLASGLSRQLCTVSRGPEGWRCPQDPCGEGFCCFLLLNPTYVSLSLVGKVLWELGLPAFIIWLSIPGNTVVSMWCGSVCCGWDETNSHRLLSAVEEKGLPLSQEESASTLSWQACIAFLGTLHWGWSSFTMHRFALAGYLLQKRKERMLLITSKRKDIYTCKGKSGWTGYTDPWKV